MTRKIILGGVAALVCLNGTRAQEVKPETAAMDYEARMASITNLETHIAQREQRLAEWGKDIVELDTRIEKRVDELGRCSPASRTPRSPAPRFPS